MERRGKSPYTAAMHLDVVDLRDFYATPLGAVARRLLRAHIRAAWPDVAGMNVAGIGYCLPYLDMFRFEAQRLVALMPDTLGAVAWPELSAARSRQHPRLGNRSLLVAEDALPLPDSSIERILLIHCLEVSESLRPLLRQIWRVLTPQGRLLLVLPNRLGVWARAERTPFGHGRPWTRSQLQAVLREAMYAPESCRSCLYAPPLRRSPCLRWARGWERAGAACAPALGGLLIAEASKRVHAPVPPAARRQPVWVRQPAARVSLGAAETARARPADSPASPCAGESGSGRDGRRRPPAR